MGWVTDKGASGAKKFQEGGDTNEYKEMAEKHKKSEAKRFPKMTAVAQTVGDMIDPSFAKMKERLETAKDFYTDKAKDASLKDVAKVVSKAVQLPGAAIVKKAAEKAAKVLKDKKKKDKKKKDKNKTANI